MANQLIKSILFLLIRDTWDVERSTQSYVRYIAKMCGILTATKSNRNQRFPVIFDRILQKALGTLSFLTALIILRQIDQLQEGLRLQSTCSRACVRVPKERGEQLTIGSISYCNSCQYIIALMISLQVHGVIEQIKIVLTETNFGLISFSFFKFAKRNSILTGNLVNQR